MLAKIVKQLDFDWISLVAMLFLLVSGLIAIFSLSLEAEREGFNNFQKQVIFLIVALATFAVFSTADYQIWKSYSGFLYAVGVILLVAVLLFGASIRGTTGWFNLGIFNIQPVELMKLFLIISLAKYFSQIQVQITLKKIAVSFIYTLIPVILAMLQPDMGSAVVMIVIWFGMLFLAGTKKQYVAGIILAGFVIITLGWGTILNDYQKDRIQSFMDPERDPLGSGYNVIQSVIAIGSGGITGKGLGHGSQSQLNFLPEKHTDFIYAAIAEESGLIGTGLIILFFGILLWRMGKTIDLSKDTFGKFLVGGVIIMIFFQTFLNIGMNLGIMPIAGLSLPFLSYGGSFLIVTLASMGLVQNVWRKTKKQKTSITEESYEQFDI
ncbi:MAG: rod shape-determining protein RodA [Patescibacteria group bacterium]|nr:rod shape-determining protein RodA [Patescibacteria group bacterium]